MKEKYDPKTEDIFLYISSEELERLMNPHDPGWYRLMSHEKKVAFLLNPEFKDKSTQYIRVEVVYDVPISLNGVTENYIYHHIYLSKDALKDLGRLNECHDRYTGTTGSQKIHIIVGEPDGN